MRGADESEGMQRKSGQIGPGGDSRSAFITFMNCTGHDRHKKACQGEEAAEGTSHRTAIKLKSNGWSPGTSLITLFGGNMEEMQKP